ncbi:MAG: class I SAM-dependent methyltransferase [Parcubacteria group bacterium]|jgi:2-polyprenyl-3-methyl-5-hydroxy-6-metoxy-1,4-benzoquinol methylase
MKKNIYKNLYSDQNNLGNLAKNPRIQSMLEIINRANPKDKNILDIGCYDGTFLSLIKNRNNNFFGLEASDWGAEKARQKGIEVNQYFFNGSAGLPYEDEFFDVITAGEIVEHIFDTDFFLEEIARALKPGGKFLLSTPNIASFGRRLLLLAGKNPIIEISPNESDSSGHIRYFTFKTLKDILGKHKFEIILSRSDYVNFSKNGKIRSVFLAKIFPRTGTSIICYAKKTSRKTEKLAG